MRCSLVSLIFFGFFGSAVAARPPAHKARRFAIRELRIEGNVTDADRAALQLDIWNAIEFVIVGQNHDDLAHPEDVIPVLAQNPALKSCADARCLLALGELLHAQRLLTIVVTRDGPAPKGEWNVKVSQFAVDAVRSLGTAELPCRSCTRDDLVGDFNRFLDPLFKNEPPPLPLCTFKVTSRPPGATVLVESVAVGETPFTHTLTAGRHSIAVEKSGFARGEAELECAAGASENAVFALTQGATQLVRNEPLQERAPHRTSTVALKIVGASLLVLGAAGVAAGAVALVRDGKGTCDLTSGHTQCPETYDTAPTGAALVGVGAAALIGGTVALVVDTMRGRRARVTADVRVGAGGAFVGARGEF